MGNGLQVYKYPANPEDIKLGNDVHFCPGVLRPGIKPVIT